MACESLSSDESHCLSFVPSSHAKHPVRGTNSAVLTRSSAVNGGLICKLSRDVGLSISSKHPCLAGPETVWASTSDDYSPLSLCETKNSKLLQLLLATLEWSRSVHC